MKAQTLAIALLVVGTPVVVAADLASPEGTVDFYLEARKHNSLEEMAKVRDFELQARELLLSRSTSLEPSTDLVRATAKDLEQSFRIPSRTTLPARSCHTGAAHYQSSGIASVPVFCERELGANISESAAFMVRVIKTPRGWRIVDNAADE